MRTDKELLEKIEWAKEKFWVLDFMSDDLIPYLSYEAAKPFLKEGVTESDWEPLKQDEASILREMEDYMDFAWDKANNCSRDQRRSFTPALPSLVVVARSR